jgi:Smr domain
MPGPSSRRPPAEAESRGLKSAFDAVRFAPDCILNLRASFPTGADAAYRAESWLRERQASGAREVLIITGRGQGSPDGVAVVRDAVKRCFPGLRRTGVIAAVQDHDPGSFVVELATLQALVGAPRRRHHPRPEPSRDAGVLYGLDPELLELLRRLAIVALEAHGVHGPSESFVTDEMARHFSRLVQSVPAGQDPGVAIRPVLERLLEEYDA